MKSFILSFSLVFFFLFSACESNKAELKDTSLTGQWQLSQLMHGWTGEIVKAETLPYLEYYQFNADGSFRKYTSQGLETTGTYTVRQINTGELEIPLTFVEETDQDKKALQFSCGGKLTLLLNKTEGLTESNLPCDGPKKYYRKLKEQE